MSKSYRSHYSKKKRSYLSPQLKLVALFVVIILLAPFVSLHAATLSAASVGLSDPRPGATANYTFTGSSVTLTPIKCIKLVYADTASGTNPPSGMVPVSCSSQIRSRGDAWFLLFETRLFYRDMSLEVTRLQTATAMDYIGYDAVFGFRGNRLFLLRN